MLEDGWLEDGWPKDDWWGDGAPGRAWYCGCAWRPGVAGPLAFGVWRGAEPGADAGLEDVADL